MKGERQAESHGAHRVPAPGGPCPHTRGLDVACESLRILLPNSRNPYSCVGISYEKTRRLGHPGELGNSIRYGTDMHCGIYPLVCYSEAE